MCRIAATGTKVCPRIAYMPQGLGKNLYMDAVGVQENIDFFGRLFGSGPSEERQRGASKNCWRAPVSAPFPRPIRR